MSTQLPTRNFGNTFDDWQISQPPANSNYVHKNETLIKISIAPYNFIVSITL